MRRYWVIIVSVFWILIFGIIKFAPTDAELLLRYASVSKFSAINLPANFAGELPFPIPTAVLSLFTNHIPVNIFLFRLPNLIISLLNLGITGILFSTGAMLIFSGSLWLFWISMSDFSAAVTLLLVMLILAVDKNIGNSKHKFYWFGFLNLWLSMTSFAGWIFVIIFIFWKLKERDWKTTGMVILIAAYAYFNAVNIYFVSEKTDLGSMVDQRVRYETTITNYREPVPLFIKRFVYNKPYFWYRKKIIEIGSYFSLEKMAFPGQEDATVSRNLWGSKSLPWIYFWQIPLVVYAITRIKIHKNIVILGGWGLLSLILGNKGDWLANSIGIPLTMAVIMGDFINQSNQRIRMAVWVMFIISVIPSFYHFVNHEQVWRDNRPLVHQTMAQMALRHEGTTISTILGRSFLYYGWIKQIEPEMFWRGFEVGMKIDGVKFDHFEKPIHKGVYVGLPGEFIGNKSDKRSNEFSAIELPGNMKLLEEAKTKDTVSFGNGDYIWTVQVN